MLLGSPEPRMDDPVMSACTLCDIVEGRGRFSRLYEDDQLVVVLEPAHGRVLVVPRAHRRTLRALGVPAEQHLLKIGRRASASLGDAGAPAAASVAESDTADATDGHVHLALSPVR